MIFNKNVSGPSITREMRGAGHARTNGALAISFEKRGLIRFQDDASDRRKRLVYLTLKGLELVERMVAKTEAVEKRIIRGIAAGELDRMYATLAKISANCFKEIATDAVIRNRLGLRKPSVKKA
jgi:hypothetical protein